MSESTNLFHFGEMWVHLFVDSFLNMSNHFRIVVDSAGDAIFISEMRGTDGIERDERRDKATFFTDNHSLRDEWNIFQRCLNIFRCNVFATRSDNNFLLTAYNGEESIFIELAQISRV